MIKKDEILLKVSSKSSPYKVGGAIAGVVKEEGRAVLQAVGAGAVNQTVKAFIIARGFMTPVGVDLVLTGFFNDIEIEGETKTALKFIAEPREKKYEIKDDVDTDVEVEIEDDDTDVEISGLNL